MGVRSLVLVVILLLSSVSGGWAQTLAAHPNATRSVRIEGFDFTTGVLAFANYRLWSESRLPGWAQLAHCTSLVIMVRQMFHYARFEPQSAPLNPTELETRIRSIYFKPMGTPPQGADRVVIPGYYNLRELSAMPKNMRIMRRVMGDSIQDALRPGWHWTPADILRVSRDSNERMEQYIRETLDRGRIAMLYLARGTHLAHAVLVLGYDDVPGQHRYIVYDPNQPAFAVTLAYDLDTREFNHPSLKGRDGWVLFPYEDMAEPPYPAWPSQNH